MRSRVPLGSWCGEPFRRRGERIVPGPGARGLGASGGRGITPGRPGGTGWAFRPSGRGPGHGPAVGGGQRPARAFPLGCRAGAGHGPAFGRWRRPARGLPLICQVGAEDGPGVRPVAAPSSRIPARYAGLGRNTGLRSAGGGAELAGSRSGAGWGRNTGSRRRGGSGQAAGGRSGLVSCPAARSGGGAAGSQPALAWRAVGAAGRCGCDCGQAGPGSGTGRVSSASGAARATGYSLDTGVAAAGAGTTRRRRRSRRPGCPATAPRAGGTPGRKGT